MKPNEQTYMTTDLKKLAEIKRYDMQGMQDGYFMPYKEPEGEWVRYSDYAALLQEVETLRGAIDCACNALTDSICVSGNDAETNLRWVKKLRALQHTGEVPEWKVEGRAILKDYDEAMASQPKTVSNATLIVIANYGELALGVLRAAIENGETKP